ncbi:MFS transporter [Mycobacterium spongiae]|uniref:MFS transporter n=1 Tax=Mycobacterium spongiae TaxID=886343 RepID=A0A975JZY0_9MYCO|nr:MFS transporter [Mycobacterium spongiae]QUR68820.1 MFS transporter [Mycobacterium spongiae]
MQISAADAPPLAGKRASTIAVALIAAFMAYLDATILIVAFPSVSMSFPHTPLSRLSWVLDAYYIVFAALLVPAGRFADLYGRRRIFAVGVALFVASSAACAAAGSVGVLITARVFQAAGAAGLNAASLALLLPHFGRSSRATAVSLWGGAAALAATVGPVFGGLLVHHANWRWIFLVNVPIGLAVLLMLRGVGEAKNRDAGILIDVPTMIGVSAGIAALTTGVIEGGNWGWTDLRTLLCLLVGGVALLFAADWTIRRRDGISEHAVAGIDRKPLLLSNVGTLLFGFSFYGLMLALVLFVTVHWHYTSLQAGLVLTPAALTTALVALPAGKVADRVGHRVPILPGGVLFFLGTLWLAAHVDSTSGFFANLLPAVLLTGAGIGMVGPTLAGASVESMPDKYFGTANSLNSASRQFGAALGTATVIAIVSQGHSLSSTHFHAIWLILGIVALLSMPFAISLTRSTDAVPENNQMHSAQ